LVYLKMNKLEELKESELKWNKAIREERQKLENGALETLNSNPLDTESLTSQWRATPPKPCTPPGAFLPPTFTDELYWQWKGAA